MYLRIAMITRCKFHYKSGSYSGRIDDNYPANWEKYVYSDTWTPINNSQDTYYTVSGWIYVENVANNDAQIWLSTRKSGETGYPSGNYSSKTTQRSRWEYLSKTVLVPADVRELNIRIDNNKKGKVWFDDVKIVKGNASQTVIVKESNYYPFGGLHKGYNNVVSANGNAVAQKFGYNGKEYQEDLGYNMHDFDMRHYDPWTARWVTVDPKAEEMRRHSPYNYAFNNPLRFIDPDGMKPEDIIIRGTAAFKTKALSNLQSLTNDKLSLDSNGKVVITSTGTENTGKTLTAGTKLVSNLVNSSKTVSVVETSGGNKTAFDGTKAKVKSDGTANIGSDARVKFNPDSTTGGVNENGNRTRPSEIGLGHELGHAETATKGEIDLSSFGKTDPDGSGTKLTKEEVSARKKENLLRKEQKLPARKVPN